MVSTAQTLNECIEDMILLSEAKKYLKETVPLAYNQIVWPDISDLKLKAKELPIDNLIEEMDQNQREADERFDQEQLLMMQSRRKHKV